MMCGAIARWSHDLDGKITGLANVSLQTDRNGNIIGLTDAGTTAFSYEYDGLDHLGNTKKPNHRLV